MECNERVIHGHDTLQLPCVCAASCTQMCHPRRFYVVRPSDDGDPRRRRLAVWVTHSPDLDYMTQNPETAAAAAAKVEGKDLGSLAE